MPEPDRIIRLKTVLGRTGLSRSTIYRKIAEGTFPPQIRISVNGAGWRESDNYVVRVLYDRRTLLILAGFALVGSAARGETMGLTSAIIDDLSRDMPLSAIGTRWQLFTDRVMGGVSNGTMIREMVAGRPAIRMRGDVSLENNGGFVQISLDLAPDGEAVDVSAWSGIELDVFGNGEEYSVHLRTSDLTRPWQSYRQSFRADPQWQTIPFRFQEFVPYRTDVPLNTLRLKRIGGWRSEERFRLISPSVACG